MFSPARLLASAAIVAVSASAAVGAERPNVLLCIADDWSYGHAGAYGCDWVETPAFDRVAREGVLFERFYTPNAKCAPSRACLLTGRNSWQLEAAANHSPIFPVKFKGYVEALADAGYRVGFTGKGWSPGSAKTADGRPRRLTGQKFSDRRERPAATGISPIDYAGNFEVFVASAGDAPWCFWYGASEPHRGYEYGSGTRVAGKSTDQIDRVPAYWPDTEVVRTDMLDYALEVEHFDLHLGRILDTLETRGELDDTLVIVTSDHGMPFPRAKGQAYEGSNHIPLAIRWPKRVAEPGRTVERFARMIDLAPTILDAAGVDAPSAGMAPMTGRTLMPVLTAVEPEREPLRRVLIGKERHDVGRPNDWGYPIRGIVTDRWIYLRNYEPSRWPGGNPETGYTNCDGSPTKTAVLDAFGSGDADRAWRLCFGRRPPEELYDLREDPDCVNNLASDPGYAGVATRLRTEMQRDLTDEGDPRMAGRGAVFDEYAYSSPAARGFYERAMAGENPRAGWIRPSDYRPEQNPDLAFESSGGTGAVPDRDALGGAAAGDLSAEESP